MPLPNAGSSLEESTLSRRLQRFVAPGFLFVFTLVFWSYALHAGGRRYQVTDEIFTLWMTRDVPSVIAALRAGADTAPPLYYFFIKAFCALFGRSAFVLRLPGIFSLYVIVLASFAMLRKYVGNAVAAAAATLSLFSNGIEVEFFARPQIIVVACFALLCLIWCRSDSDRPRPSACVGIAVLLGLALSMHFYGVLLVPTLFVMELAWAYEHRVLRWRIFLAIAAGFGVLLLWLPVILPIMHATHESAGSAGYYAKPNVRMFFAFLRNIIGPTSLFLAVIIGILLGSFYRLQQLRLLRRTGEAPTTPLVALDHLGIVAFATFLQPLLTYVFAATVTHVLNERYLWATSLCMGLALALAVRRLRWPPMLQVALAVLIVGLYALHTAELYLKPPETVSPFEEALRLVPNDGPVAIPDGGVFFMLAESKDPTIRARNIYLFLPKGMADPNTEPARIAAVWKQLRPNLPIYTNEDFLALHRKFYILTLGDPGEGLTTWAMHSMNPRLTLLGKGFRLFEIQP